MPAYDVEEGVYVLGRDWLASSRLSLQHFVLKSRQGWLLHPAITSSITSSTSTGTSQPLRIADVAAGNCIWTMDLHSTNPSFEVTSFDISSSMFPSASELPSTINLETWDMFTPPPAKYHSYFDIIHIRLVMAAIFRRDTNVLLQNLLALLKPNGWIQWQDTILPITHALEPATMKHLPLEEWPLFMKHMYIESGLYEALHWLANLDEFLREQGRCTDVEKFVSKCSTGMLRYQGDLTMWMYDELLRGPAGEVMERSEEGRKTKREVRESLDKEWEKTRVGERCWDYETIVAIGRKPAE